MNEIQPRFRCIGRGFCGSVWSLEGTHTDAQAIKREDGGPGRSLQNDYDMHLRVLSYLKHLPPNTPLAVPACYTLIQANDLEWWRGHSTQFPSGFTACKSLVSERIPPFPKSARDNIIDKFCPVELADFVCSNPGDADCLIRPYLGRRGLNRISNSRFRRFSLRNYPLHLDKFDQLGMDPVPYAELMAQALAMMHWGARVDANDVEFVIAPPRANSDKDKEKVLDTEMLGPHMLWILDFDCCRPMTWDEEGVKQACDAFFRNDPYFPRPRGRAHQDYELWTIFRQRFLEASEHILQEQDADLSLASLLMDEIEKKGRELEIAQENLDADGNWLET